MRNRLTACVGTALLLVWSLSPVLADVDQMPALVPVCALCHGDTGPSPFAGVPTIHGLPHGVIDSALFGYQRGLRPCRVSECSKIGTCPDMNMCDIVDGMTHETRQELGAWYAAQPFPKHQDPYDPELAARGRELHERYCEVCHTRYGSDPVDDASMLRGQRKVYLRTALQDFKEGKRSIGVTTMDARIRTFSGEDLDALAEFYSGPAAYPFDD